MSRQKFLEMEGEAISLSVYYEDSKAYDARSNLFSAVCIHAQLCFSMLLQRLGLGLFYVKERVLELFTDCSVLKVVDVGCRRLNSERVDVAFFLHGTDGHGE
jgi:hypothetical protein